MKKLPLLLLVLFAFYQAFNFLYAGSLFIVQGSPEQVTVWVDGKYYDAKSGYVIYFEDFPSDEAYEIDKNSEEFIKRSAKPIHRFSVGG